MASIDSFPLYAQLGSMLDVRPSVRFKSGVLGQPIKETHGTVGTHVAAAHGIEVVANGFRCPPNRANGGSFTDAMGTTCGVELVAEAVTDVLKGVSQAAEGTTHTTGRDGGKAAAITEKNASILARIREAGGNLFHPKSGDGKSSLFRMRSPKERYDIQVKGIHEMLDHTRTYLTEGRLPEPLTSWGKMPRGFDQRTIDALHPDVKELIKNSSNEEITKILEGQAAEFQRTVSRNIRVSVPRDRIDTILNEGKYLTTHQASSNHSGPEIRSDYEQALGLPRELDAELRPASGYMMHPDWEQAAVDRYVATHGKEPTEFTRLDRGYAGAVSCYGEIDLILRPEVAGRSAFGQGDSANCGLLPSPLYEEDPTRALTALVSADNKDHERIGEQTLALLESHRTGSFKNLNLINGSSNPDHVDPSGHVSSREYFEALIGGSFGTEDIAAIKMDYSLLALPDSTKPVAREDELKQIRDEFFTADRLRSMGLTDEEIQYIQGMMDNYKNYKGESDIPEMLMTRNINLLLEHRKAKARKKRIEDLGIEVKVTHEKGLDPFDPTNYGGKPGDDIEQILVGRVNEKFPEAFRSARKLKEEVARRQAEDAARVAAGGEERHFG